MIPTGGVSTILSASKTLFTGLKPIIFLLLGVMVAFIIIEFLIDLIFKRANEEGDVDRQETKILGSKVSTDIKEFGWLAKKLGMELPAGWQTKIKTQVFQDRLQELSEKYGISPEIQLEPKKNFFQRVVSKIKRSK